MQHGHFYFLNEQYFIDFPDNKLMANKETINGIEHKRPCFYAIEDKNTGLFWLVPVSSQVSKYKTLYEKKLNRYKRCDTIVFGELLGKECAFLIQNMCPAAPKYINNVYLDKKSNLPVKISGNLEKELIDKAKRVLALHRNGVHLVFPDILKIEAELIMQLHTN